MYKLCVDYYNEYGNLRINRNYIVDGIKLGVWIGQQRVRYNRKDGSISNDRIEKLNKIEMIWDEMFQKWMDLYDIALLYYNEYGNVNVTQNYKYKEKSLGKWIYRQREQLKNDKLNKVQVKLLKDIGIE